MQVVDYLPTLQQNSDFASQALIVASQKNEWLVWHFSDLTTGNVAKLSAILKQLDGTIQGHGSEILVTMSQAAGRYLATNWLAYFPDEVGTGQRLRQLIATKDIIWQAGRFRFNVAKRAIIYGILNITPDSFYDGGQYQTEHAINQRIHEMVDAGVDVIEVNGQTTRPGFTEVTPAVELERIMPTIRSIRRDFPQVAIAVDTYKRPVMEAVIAAGVDIINDVNAFVDDPAKLELLQQSNVGLLTMHSSRETEYTNLTQAMHHFFETNLATLMAAGIKKERIALDQGIGYSKVPHGAQDYVMMRNIAEFNDLKRPMMIAVSRKGYLGLLLGLDKADRLPMTLVTEALMYLRGGRILRIHDVKATKQMVTLLARIENGFWVEGEKHD